MVDREKLIGPCFEGKCVETSVLRSRQLVSSTNPKYNERGEPSDAFAISVVSSFANAVEGPGLRGPSGTARTQLNDGLRHDHHLNCSILFFDKTHIMQGEYILFVTGRLAERGLTRVLEELSQKLGFRYEVQVMPISVAALLTTKWVRPRIEVSHEVQRIVLPGYCRGDLDELSRELGVPVQLGPRDLRKLPEFFGQVSRRDETYGKSDIEIIAEINHAKDLSISEIEKTAEKLLRDGADIIDVGCDPGSTWEGVAKAVQHLKSMGARVSIDSFNPREIVAAVDAGAELVLSLNSSNLSLADELDVEWVLIPDEPSTLGAVPSAGTPPIER